MDVVLYAAIRQPYDAKKFQNGIAEGNLKAKIGDIRILFGLLTLKHCFHEYRSPFNKSPSLAVVKDLLR